MPLAAARRGAWRRSAASCRSARSARARVASPSRSRSSSLIRVGSLSARKRSAISSTRSSGSGCGTAIPLVRRIVADRAGPPCGIRSSADRHCGQLLSCVVVRTAVPRAPRWRASAPRRRLCSRIMSLTATARSIPGTLRQEVVIDGQHRLITDEPEHLGGDGSGPAPHELFPAALAACVSTTLVMYARTKGWDLGERDGRGRLRPPLDAAQVRDRGRAQRRPRRRAARAPGEGRSLVSASPLDRGRHRVRRARSSAAAREPVVELVATGGAS